MILPEDISRKDTTLKMKKEKMPPGIPYIIGNEAAERFSFYGMKTILIVFMTDHLLMSESKGTIWLHTFVMAAYFLPLIGGILSDISWGKYNTIMRLSLFYCLGHAVLAAYESQTSLAIGLGLIAVGAGGIKSCVSAHVGDQFNKESSGLLDRVFGFFYISINLGAFLSTLLTPWLMKAYGPSIAFGVPGVLMFFATWIFWLGRKKFIAIPAVGWKKFRDEVFTAHGLRIILKLGAVYFFISVFWALYDQTASTWVLQAKRELMDKTIRLGSLQVELLPDQVQAINPFLILVLSLVFSYVVYPFVNRFFRLTYMRKISIGLFITVFSFLVIAWVEGRMEQAIPVHVGWQLLAFFIITAAEVMVAITALEFSYTQAPAAMKSLIMGLFWLTITMGNFITTEVNRLIMREVSVTEIAAGENTFVTLAGMKGIEQGLKFETEKVEGLQIIRSGREKNDTVDFSGTFLIGGIDTATQTFELLDIDKKPIRTLQLSQALPPQPAQVSKLKGSAYFLLFVYLMLGAATLFVPVAMWYKEETYIREGGALT